MRFFNLYVLILKLDYQYNFFVKRNFPCVNKEKAEAERGNHPFQLDYLDDTAL